MKYFPLYIPFLLSYALGDQAESAYWISWLGSWFIIWICLAGKIKPLPDGKSWQQQLMRPIVIPHLVFAGFTALSSVFFFMFIKEPQNHNNVIAVLRLDELSITIHAQRLYVLGHAALTHAILLTSYYKPYRYQIKSTNAITTLITISGLLLIMDGLLPFVPALSQWIVRVEDMRLVAAALLLAQAIPKRSITGILIGGGLLGFSVFKAVLSGFKEEVIIPLIMLGAYLFPFYKRTIIALSIPLVLFILFILPSYSIIFRKLSWENKVDSQTAAVTALNTVRSGNRDVIQKSNQDFLLFRISEIHMFNRFQSNVPEFRNYYGLQIIEQSLLSLLPRALYENKPITEELVMERVFENKIAERYSNVSAKPQLIVDGYLSFGAFGVWAFCFIMGAASSWASRKAEWLFGGYYWGTCLAYTGLFQIFWRGNCLEFMLNAVFWSIILMYLLFYLGRIFKLIVPAET